MSDYYSQGDSFEHFSDNDSIDNDQTPKTPERKMKEIEAKEEVKSEDSDD